VLRDMKTARKYLIIGISFVVLGIAGSGFYLVSKIGLPVLKTSLIGFYIGAPANIVRVELKMALAYRNFGEALEILERQRIIAEAMGFTNQMKFELIENTYLVVERALATGEQAIFSDWVDYLYELSPDIHIGVSLVSIVNYSNDFEKTKKFAEQALEALPTDELPYRAMLLADDRSGTRGNKAELCKRYRNAQLTAIDPVYYPNASFQGQGLRTLIMALEDEESIVFYAVSQGLKLGEFVNATFEFDRAKNYHQLRLIMPTVPGLKFTLDHIIIQGSRGRLVLSGKQLEVTPTYGYVLSRDEFLITSRFGEALLIRSNTHEFPETSQVMLRYKLERLPITNFGGCQQY